MSSYICNLSTRRATSRLTSGRARGPMVRTHRLHPFKLWLMASLPRRTQEWAAHRLGIARVYLTTVLSGAKTPSAELYRDMVKLSKGAVTLRELVELKKPSARP